MFPPRLTLLLRSRGLHALYKMNEISETITAFGCVATIAVLISQVFGASLKTSVMLAISAMILFFVIPTALGIITWLAM